MARDDASNIGGRAAVPANFQPPSNAAGALTSQFDLSADGGLSMIARRNAREELTLANLSHAFLERNTSEAVTAPGFLLSGAQAVNTTQIMQTEKRKRDDGIRFALDQAKAALLARLAKLDAEIAAIDKRLEEIRQRRIVIADQMEALDEIERIRRSGKKLDPNNPAHRRLLEAGGITEAQANSENYALVIRQTRSRLSNEDESFGTEHNSLLKHRGVVAYERQGVVGALGEIENADTDEARIFAERRATTTLGAQQLGEAATQTTSVQARMVAADAVGASADSEAYNRVAVVDVSQTRNATDQSFDWDAPPPRPPSASV